MEIDSEEENKALDKDIKRRGYTKRSVNFWIGLSEIHKYTNTEIHKYTNTQIQHMTKCQKDPACGIIQLQYSVCVN